jgi:hypothetical protein
MAADTGSATPAAAPAPVRAPAVIRGPMDKHESHFTPRKQIQDYKDRLYHGKPEYNYQGIAYRPPNPNKIERLHTVALMPKQPVSDGEISELVWHFVQAHGIKPTICTYPGVGNRRWRGLTVPDVGQVLLELVPNPDCTQAWVDAPAPEVDA